MNSLVEIDDVTVAFNRQQALSKISAKIEPGTMLAVTGPSAAGKSTLLWAIAGAVLTTSGNICVGGVPILDADTARRLGVTLIPQGNGLASVLTARENILVALLATGTDTASASTLADNALDLLGVAAQADQLVDELSGGQRQRVAIARAIALKPRVLLIDEIGTGLDHTNRDRVLNLLRMHTETGAVIIMATHDSEMVAACDENLRLVNGVADT